jgi:inhibitor of KinA sporulation pathway (predicted exonuclease)
VQRAVIRRRRLVARKLDQILVIDLEATCWEDAPPPGEQTEIIEVGLCVLDASSGERLARRSILVIPERSTVSPFCTALTTLTQEELKADGVSFEEACNILRREHLSEERTWAGWGDYDRREFHRQCDSFGIDYPFGQTHLNVKNLFAIAMGLESEVGLPKAMEILGLTQEGIHHRGMDDAWNIALILSHLLMRARQAT